MNAWIGVDLDGTLAYYDENRFDPLEVGPPIEPIVQRVRVLLEQGVDVRIFTARVDGGQVASGMGVIAGEAYRDVLKVRQYIDKWCMEQFGRVLPITNQKDYGMLWCWDDRAKQVVMNSGQFIEEMLERRERDLTMSRRVIREMFPGEMFLKESVAESVMELCRELQLTRRQLEAKKAASA